MAPGRGLQNHSWDHDGPMAHPATHAASPLDATEPTHPCIRCGRPGVAIDKALCENCNPLELAQPSATQVHGIAALGIIAFVVFLFAVGRFALAGTGPFEGAIDGVAATEGGLAVTIVVHNDGTRSGATTCRVVGDARAVGGRGGGGWIRARG